ncbi:MAG: DUF4276 family protein [Deltaproteobacteria bacterium]|nr:DUF4276 family protein [Deltaproteobacteria bacterium]
MARLYLFAEGSTEQTFASNLLIPHLSRFGVYLHPPVLIAHARKKGVVHRGGGRNYPPMKNDILRFLAQEKTNDVFFTTMIDLYAIAPDFPGLKESVKMRNVPESRVKFLEESWARDISDSRFIPYIQLHEYEAYLFSDPKAFHSFYDNSQKQIAVLQAIADKHSTPEQINDGPETAPSKRITKQFPDFDSDKPVAGPLTAEIIGLQTIRNKCPHFHAWVSRLETLGEQTAHEKGSPG